MTTTYLPEIDVAAGIRQGRNVRDGYVRGWGLEFGDLAARVAADPLYVEATGLAAGLTYVSEPRRMNLYLLIRFFLPRLGRGNIVEFGAYKGGNALFMAHVAARTLPSIRVIALDTFSGMPPTDETVDAHKAGDFGDANVEDLRGLIREKGIRNLDLVQGRFEDTAAGVAAAHGPFALANIDCDIYSAVACSYEVCRHSMVAGGYIVFDDATTSSCIGATEAVENLVIRRDGCSSEQIYPHFVFRA